VIKLVEKDINLKKFLWKCQGKKYYWQLKTAYRCNKSFGVWMTILPKGLPNLFSILKADILIEI
jgi:hypothetical protein